MSTVSIVSTVSTPDAAVGHVRSNRFAVAAECGALGTLNLYCACRLCRRGSECPAAHAAAQRSAAPQRAGKRRTERRTHLSLGTLDSPVRHAATQNNSCVCLCVRPSAEFGCSGTGPPSERPFTVTEPIGRIGVCALMSASALLGQRLVLQRCCDLGFVYTVLAWYSAQSYVRWRVGGFGR